MVDVRGDVLRPPHGTTPAAVKANKIQKWDPLRAMKVYVCAVSSGYRQGISLSRKSVSRLTIASMCTGCPDKNLRK